MIWNFHSIIFSFYAPWKRVRLAALTRKDIILKTYLFKILLFIVSLNVVTHLLVCIIYFCVSVIVIWIFFSIFLMKVIFYLINTFVLKLLMLSKCLKVLIWGRFKNSLIYMIKDLILCPLLTVCNFACIYVSYMCMPVLWMSDLCVSCI